MDVLSIHSWLEWILYALKGNYAQIPWYFWAGVIIWFLLFTWLMNPVFNYLEIKVDFIFEHIETRYTPNLKLRWNSFKYACLQKVMRKHKPKN